MSNNDYYSTLGVSRDASQDDIKKAYRKMAVKYHPDKNPGDKAAEEKFKEVSEAYDVLHDPDKRAAYDRYGSAAFASGGRGSGGGGSYSYSGNFRDASDIFSEVFGDGGFGDIFGFGSRSRMRQSQPRQTRGSDLIYNLQISLEEAFKGVEKTIKYHRNVQCSACKGSGAEGNSKRVTCPTCGGAGYVSISQGFFHMQQTCSRCGGMGTILEHPCKVCGGSGITIEESKAKIKIPAGVSNGMKLRLAGYGEAGRNGGPAGDLYIAVIIAEHKIFERHEDDLYCTKNIPFVIAALGGEIEVETIDGKCTLKVPAGTQSGSVLRMKNQGMVHMNTKTRGNQYVNVAIEVPKRLTKEQRESLENFAAASGFTTDKKVGFFQKIREKFE